MSTQPLFASTLVTSPSMVCVSAAEAIWTDALPKSAVNAIRLASASVFMVSLSRGASRSSGLRALLSVLPALVVLSSLLPGTLLPALLIGALAAQLLLPTLLIGTLAALAVATLLIGALTALPMSTLLLPSL